MFSGLFSLPFAPVDGAAVAVRNPSLAANATAPDSFFAGSENALVRSLGSAVTRGDLPYNPIVLYGAAGSGKSSVARGLVSLRRQQFGFSKVIETTGVDFARSLAHAVENASVTDLRAEHRRCDILLVDDAHKLAGKSAAQAVDQGFAHAWITIIDTHVTTIVSAAILFIFGTGPVKGFAVTLTFGLLANLFTAVFVSRVIFDAILNRKQRGEALSI